MIMRLHSVCSFRNLTLGSLIFMAFSCSDSKESSPRQPVQHNDTHTIAVAEDTLKALPEKPRFSYTALPVKGNDSIQKYIKKHFTGDTLEVIRQLNRADAKYWYRLDTLIVPDPVSLDIMAYSVYPAELAIIDSVEKFFIFSYPSQTFAVYEYGQLKRWGATNMGKKSTPTPTGLHFTNWKGRKITSTVNANWILEYNFNIMNFEGVGWHQYDMPGHPVSHSCLRLFREDAMYLYNYADQWKLDQSGQILTPGNPVLVYGVYPFGGRKPWYSLLEDPDALNISAEELTQLITPHLQKIKDAESKRRSLRPAGHSDTSARVQGQEQA